MKLSVEQSEVVQRHLADPITITVDGNKLVRLLIAGVLATEVVTLEEVAEGNADPIQAANEMVQFRNEANEIAEALMDQVNLRAAAAGDPTIDLPRSS